MSADNNILNNLTPKEKTLVEYATMVERMRIAKIVHAQMDDMQKVVDGPRDNIKGYYEMLPQLLSGISVLKFTFDNITKEPSDDTD